MIIAILIFALLFILPDLYISSVLMRGAAWWAHLLFGWKQLTVRNIDLAFDDLPEAFNGYRVVQLSDMHVGSYGTSPAFLEKVVQRVHDEQRLYVSEGIGGTIRFRFGATPEIIVFTLHKLNH